MTIRKITVREIHAFVRESWNLVKPHRIRIALVWAFAIGIQYALEKIPHAGPYVSATISPFFEAGLLLCAARAFRRLPVDIATLIRPLREPELARRLVPYILMTYGLSVLGSFSELKPVGPVLIFISVLTSVFYVFVSFLLLFSVLPSRETFGLSARAVARNFWTFLLAGMLYGIAYVVVMLPMAILVPLEEKSAWVPTLFHGWLLAGIYGAIVNVFAFPLFSIAGVMVFDGVFTGDEKTWRRVDGDAAG